MNQSRVLVAASPGISSEAWISRKIELTFPDGGTAVTQIGTNKFLTKALHSVAADLTFFPCASGIPRRSEIRNALADAAHLLLLWDGRGLTELLFEARLRGTPTKVHVIEVTEVANRDSNEPFDAYVGRGTPWGNPFHVGKQEGQFERDEAIARYRTHFQNKIVNDPGLRNGLLSLRGLRIACHCKPLACHADVIAEYLNSLDPESVATEIQKPITSRHRFEPDTQSVFGFLRANSAATETLNIFEQWKAGAPGRAYEVLRDQPDGADVLEAEMTFSAADSSAGSQLDALCAEQGVFRRPLA